MISLNSSITSLTNRKNWVVQTGVVLINHTTGVWANQNINFPTRFKAGTFPIATVQTGGYVSMTYMPTIYEVNENGMVFSSLFNFTGASNVRWQAIGEI